MTTTRENDQHPETPVVHLSRRAALEAERAASRRPARRARPAEPSAVVAEPTPTPVGRRASAARVTTEHVDARITRVVRRPAARGTTAPASATKRTAPTRTQRASRITVTSAIAALAMFAASAMPAHASAGTSLATSTIAPTVRTQDYAVTQAITATGLDRDGFTIGGGSIVVGPSTGGKAGVSAANAVSYGGDVRSPFPGRSG